MSTFIGWLIEQSDETLDEANTRYSVEINYRTKIKEILENYAKITLGFVSAALKQANLHAKQIFDDGLVRIIVSSRNWDDGEWVVVVSWNPHHNCFIITTGFYNKMTRDISIKRGGGKKCGAENAAEIASEVKTLMHTLKGLKDRHVQKLKGVPLKRGPK
jgi:hypothetical protein